MPEKLKKLDRIGALKVRTLSHFQHSLLQNIKKLKGEPFGEFFLEKSLTMPKNWKGLSFPLVSPGIVCYVERWKTLVQFARLNDLTWDPSTKSSVHLIWLTNIFKARNLSIYSLAKKVSGAKVTQILITIQGCFVLKSNQNLKSYITLYLEVFELYQAVSQILLVRRKTSFDHFCTVTPFFNFYIQQLLWKCFLQK